MNIEKLKQGDQSVVARRSFVKALNAVIGAKIVFSNLMPEGFMPVALGQTAERNSTRRPVEINGRPERWDVRFGMAFDSRISWKIAVSKRMRST